MTIAIHCIPQGVIVWKIRTISLSSKAWQLRHAMLVYWITWLDKCLAYIGNAMAVQFMIYFVGENGDNLAINCLQKRDER
jgi:hypothetical protein